MLAPIGYLNVRQIADGRELRTVQLDPERAALMRWAFETYATGEWSLNRVASELELRGLRLRATAKRVAKPVPANKLIYAAATGKVGDRYPYWVCLGRHKYKNGCDLPYLPAAAVETAVIQQWHTEHMAEATVTELQGQLLADLKDYTAHTTDEVNRLKRQASDIDATGANGLIKRWTVACHGTSLARNSSSLPPT
jgi:hypothetical protein